MVAAFTTDGARTWLSPNFPAHPCQAWAQKTQTRLHLRHPHDRGGGGPSHDSVGRCPDNIDRRRRSGFPE
jgi:hypothetical protein